MKKLLIVASALCLTVAASAQQQKPAKKNNRTTRDTTATSGTGQNKKGMRRDAGNTSGSTMGGNNSGNNNSGTNTSGTTGTSGSGNTGTTGGNMNTTGSGSTGTTGSGNMGTTGSGTTGSGNTGMDNMGTSGANGSGSMVSTGRYSAMGVVTGNLHRKDAKFLVMAGSSNNLELQLSQQAVQRATNPAVKDFARMMVEHHTMSSQEMKSMLSRKGAAIPDSALLPMHRLQMETVMAAQGEDFDKAYMRIMVDAHEEDVDEFEDEVTDARDADVRAFAARMLPVLQTHYTRAKDLRKQVR